MIRMVHDGAFLVVEGPDDARFWRPRQHGSRELVEGEGKKNVIGGIARIEEESISGVLGIVDEDYDGLLERKWGVRNLVTTDAHDLECVLCRSRALDTVLVEYGSRAKIRRFEERAGVDVRTALLERAMVFGRLRLAVQLHGLKIEPRALEVRRFVDRANWTVDEIGLVRAVARVDGGDDEGVIGRHVAGVPRVDGWRVAQGHDMLEVLRIGLMRVLGDMKASVGTREIGRVLRAAMSGEELRRTGLWADVRRWEEEGGREYLILAE